MTFDLHLSAKIVLFIAIKFKMVDCDFFLISWLTKPPSHENAKSENDEDEHRLF